MSALYEQSVLAGAVCPAGACQMRPPDLGDSRTIFQDTRKPLTDWFRAMYWVTTQKDGASALGLQRVGRDLHCRRR